MIPVSHLITLGVILFSIGLFGTFIRKNAIVMLMCIEVMLNAVNLLFIAFAVKHSQADGVAMALFVICVAAVEAVIGLAIILKMQGHKNTLATDQFSALKG